MKQRIIGLFAELGLEYREYPVSRGGWGVRALLHSEDGRRDLDAQCRIGQTPVFRLDDMPLPVGSFEEFATVARIFVRGAA